MSNTHGAQRTDIKLTTFDSQKFKQKFKQHAIQSIKLQRYNKIQSQRFIPISNQSMDQNIIYRDGSLDGLIRSQVNNTIQQSSPADYIDLTADECIKLMCEIENEIRFELYTDEYNMVEQQWLAQAAKDDNITAAEHRTDNSMNDDVLNGYDVCNTLCIC